MFEKVAQSNARFNAMDRLVVVIHSVRMPVGFGRTALGTKGRPLANMAHLKSSIIEVKAENNCLAHALIIAIARMNKELNKQSWTADKGRSSSLGVGRGANNPSL
jgi:ribosome-associated translation inhibitor RaiA